MSLGAEAAAQLKLDRFNKETTVADNKKAVQLLRDAGIVVEAQFIVVLENETRETLEETYQMARDWKPDLANWAMYTPWPFSDLFQELGEKVEVFDYDKYNFVTPIMKPDAMNRAELLDRVNYWGPQSKGKVNFGFDGDRKRAGAGGIEWRTSHNRKLSGPKQAELMACGGSTEQMAGETDAALEVAP